MTTTINISLPKPMLDDAKKVLARRGYTSISELVRDALREVLYPQFTENGFTPEFEEAVLRSESQPEEKDKVWRTEKDVKDYFKRLKQRIKKHVKS